MNRYMSNKQRMNYVYDSIKDVDDLKERLHIIAIKYMVAPNLQDKDEALTILDRLYALTNDIIYKYK